MSSQQYKGEILLNNSEIDNYNVVEYAVHAESNRHNFDSVSYGETLGKEHDCFRSAYNHSDEIKDYFKKNHKLSGYSGSVNASRLLLATDKKSTAEEALKDVQLFVKHLEAKYEISRNYIYYMFDGINRFYLMFPEELFGGFLPTEKLPVLHDVIKSKLCDGAFSKAFDYKIYNHTAMLPLLNAFRKSTNKYTVELTAEQIFSNADAIKEISSKPCSYISRIPNDELPVLFSLLKEEAISIVTESRRFLQILYGDKPNGVINLRFLLDGQKPFNQFAYSLDKAISMAQSFNGDKNVFYGLATRIDKSSGEKSNCLELNVIYADIDYGVEGHKKKPLYTTEQEAMDAIRNCKLKPTVITHSGHGFQVLWKMKEPYLLKGGDINRIENLMRKLNEHLGGDPTQNVDRIFRMPFTLNIKAEPFIETKIVEMDGDRIYDLEDLEKWIGQFPDKPIHIKVNFDGVQENSESLPFSKLEKVKESCVWLQGAYKSATEEHHIGHEDRMRLANLLSNFEGGVDEVLNVLSNCSDYNKETTEYQLRTLKGVPPLCASICKEKCSAMFNIGKNSPVAFAYKSKASTVQDDMIIMPINIFEKDGVYIKQCGKSELGIYSLVSSFNILPKELLVLKDGDCLTCDVTTQAGVSYKDILIENSDWHSKSKLLKAIGHSDCSFFGSDNDIQALCSFVIKKNPPRKQGSKVIGLLNDTWVIKDLNITKEGIQPVLSTVAYSKGSDSFMNKIMYKPLNEMEHKSMLDEFYKTIFRVNDPNIIMAWIGWLFATPMKPIITKLAGGFPLLQVYGGMGSGKTSTAAQMMRLSGYKENQTMSCTQRSFPMLKLLSSTNAIPVYLDEYKEKDMKQDEIDSLQRYMRKSYSGEVESKGKADQTTEDYILAAPVAVMGEWSINQPAIKERLLVARFTGDVKTNKNLNQEFEKLKALELEGFMPEYIQFILRVDIKILFAESLDLVKTHFKDIEVAPRVVNNLSVMLMGLELFKRFGELKGCKVPEMNIPELLNKQLAEITGTKTGQVRSAVDQLVEELSIMAQRSSIDKYTHFKVLMIEDRIVIALRFNLIFPAFNEYAERTNYEGDQLDKKSYMNLFTDCPYIVEKDRPVRFGTSTYRCICIDVDKAREVGLNLEGFIPTPENLV